MYRYSVGVGVLLSNTLHLKYVNTGGTLIILKYVKVASIKLSPMYQYTANGEIRVHFSYDF